MKCLIESCPRDKVKSRGLCAGCYECALRKIREGKATWVDLEQAGMALSKDERLKTAPFTIEFEKKFGKDK